MSNPENKPQEENPFEGFNFFSEETAGSGQEMPELDFTGAEPEPITSSDVPPDSGLFDDLAFGGGSSDANASHDETPLVTETDVITPPFGSESTDSENSLTAAALEATEGTEGGLVPLVTSEKSKDGKGGEKDKKEKPPKQKKEKKPREKKEGAGFSLAAFFYLGLTVLGIIGVLLGDVYLILNPPSGATMMYYVGPVLIMTVTGLAMASVPFLFWRVRNELRYGEVMLGLSVLAVGSAVIALFIELYKYDFLMKL